MTIYDLIEKHEGRKNKPYKCTAKHWTIGVGWNLDANPLPEDIAFYLKQNGEITDDMIDRLLQISVGAAVVNCHRLFPGFDKFAENRRMALTDFVFQLGYAGARCFIKTIAAINANNWEGAAREMEKSNWFYQTTNRAAEIINMIEGG